MSSRWTAWPLLMLVLLLGCKRPAGNVTEDAGADAWFADVTDEVGLDFTHDPGPIDGKYFMPQSVGSGGAFIDLEGDGRLAVYLVHNGGPSGKKNQLFRQRPDRTFQDISAGSGLDVAGFGMGVAVADVNNDGLPDVYLSEYGGGRLFLNQGKGKFVEARDCGLAAQRWGTAVSFLDYDRDGWLDLVVVNYVDLDPTHVCTRGGTPDYCQPEIFKGCITRLYRNRGRDRTGKWLGFEDRTDAARLGKTPGPGLGVLCADFDGDGWPDVFVANDGAASHLWINQRDGTFKEEAVPRGLAHNGRGEAQGNMGVAYGDVDGKGLLSLVITHISPQYPGLWKEMPGPRRGYFQENAAATGLTGSRSRATGWGVTLSDFDNDGALDLVMVNGKVMRYGKPPSPSHWDAYSERNQVFANDGSGRFVETSPSNPALCATPNAARGLAVGDFDGDGGLDLLVTVAGGKARLLRNVAARRGHWLTVRATDLARKRDAIGAEVRVRAGDRVWRRLVQPSQSYLCSNDPRAHFGLGTSTRVDAVEVLWPDGHEERFDCDRIDRAVEVRRGEGRPAPKGDRSP